MKQLQGKNILIISNEGWGDIWYSKHNYAFELSKDNLVFFINPPAKWKFQNLFNCRITKKQITDNLYTIEYTNFLPPSLFYQQNNFIVSKRLRRFIKKITPKDCILWTFDPYRLTNPELLGANFCILHLVDKYYDSYPGEKQIKQKASAIVAVSNQVLYNGLQHKPTLIVPHGIADSEFNADQEEVNSIQKQFGENFGLYVGMIDKRMDFKSLEKIIISFPEIPFVFVGANLSSNSDEHHRLFVEKRYSNCIHIGPKPFKTLKNYIAASTFCLAPMDISISGNEISHHKVFQYLAMGKPVFCPQFTEYTSVGHLFRPCNTTDDYLYQIKSLIQSAENPEIIRERIAYAREHAFHVHLNSISNFIERVQQADTRS